MPKTPVHIPPSPGTYVLLLSLLKTRTIGVGKLGTIDFSAGWYAYVGSAMGPGGVAARVGRHNRNGKKVHWHIDYLRPATSMEGVFIVVGRQINEHRWAHLLQNPPLSGQPINGFGATDCRCKAHLFHYPRRPSRSRIIQELKARWIPLPERG